MGSLIIGGGAAGLMCAGFAARAGKKVTVLERNDSFARKVRITGKGRCNVTNNCPPEEIIRNVRTNPRFLYSAVNAFSPQDTMDLFESLGVPLKTERGRRVFPVSDRADDIAGALIRFAQDNGASLLPGKRVKKLLIKDGRMTGAVLASGEPLEADKVVIATGGRSYPRTGSDGDGYRLAAAAGHSIIPQRPSLVSVLLKESWCVELSGLSLKNVELSLLEKGKKIYQELGEMLFTHKGVSGPLVLSASAYMSKEPENYQILLNLKPALTPQQLDNRLLRDFAEAKNRDFGNALDCLLPRSLIPVAVRLSGIPGTLKVHSVTKEQREDFAALLQAFPLTPIGFGSLEEAVITSGGVCVNEINPKTMASKRVEGLFFAGEVIDVDAFTGGYNLQIAFSTAVAAAQAL